MGSVCRPTPTPTPRHTHAVLPSPNDPAPPGFFTEGEEGGGFIEEWKIGTRLSRTAATAEEIVAKKEEIRIAEEEARAEAARLAREAKEAELAEINAKLENEESPPEGEELEQLQERKAQLEAELAPPAEAADE